MALNNLGLGVTFTARDAMSGVLGRLQRAFSGLEMGSRAAVATIGAGFAAMAAGIGVVSMGIGGLEGAMNLASAAGRFEASITRIGLVAQTPTNQLGAISDAALNAAQASGFATGEVTQGLEDIAAMGFTGAQSVQMLNPALGLAAAGAISVADAASAMGSAMKVFGLATDEVTMQSTASKLLGIANTTALQAHDLRIALGTVGRGASAAKQDLDEMLISMGLVKNTGVDATVAASSVSSALLFMAENAEKFDKIGVKVEDSDGHFRDFLDVVLDVNKALDDTGSDAAAVATIKDLFQRFGITAYQGIATQLKTGILDEATGKTYYLAEAVEFLRKKQNDFGNDNIAMKNADIMLQGFEGTTKRLGAAWETLKITLGGGFSAVFLPLLKLVVDGVIAMERVFRKISPAGHKFAAGLFVIASAMTIAAGASLILSGSLAVLLGAVMLVGWPFLAFLAAAGAMMAVFAAATAVFTGALVAFGAGVYVIFSENLGGSLDSLMKWWKRVKVIYESVVGLFQKGELRGAAAEAFEALDEPAKQMVVDITLLLMKLEVFLTSFWERFKEIMAGPGLDALGRVFDSVMNLGRAFGVVDSQTYELSKTLTGDDFAVKGKMAAEALANMFIKVADKIAWVLDKWAELKGKEDTFEKGQGIMGEQSVVQPGLFDLRRWGVGGWEEQDDKKAEARRWNSARTASPQMQGYAKIKDRADIEAENAALEKAEEDRKGNESWASKIADLLSQSRKDSGNGTQVVNFIVDGEVLATMYDKTKNGQRAGHFAQGSWGSSGTDGDW